MKVPERQSASLISTIAVKIGELLGYRIDSLDEAFKRQLAFPFFLVDKIKDHRRKVSKAEIICTTAQII